MSEKYLEVKNLCGGYEASQVLFDISFAMTKTGVTAIVGRNGAGKSTLLKLLAQVVPPTKGALKINGTVYQNIRRQTQRGRYCKSSEGFKRRWIGDLSN